MPRATRPVRRSTGASQSVAMVESGSRSGMTWQRLRIVGSNASGAAQPRQQSRVAGRLFQRLQQRVRGHAVHALGRVQHHDLAAIAPPRGLREADREPHFVDSDVLARFLLRCLLGRVVSPAAASPGVRARSPASAPAGRDANATAPDGNWRIARKRGVAAAYRTTTTARAPPPSRIAPPRSDPGSARHGHARSMRRAPARRATARAIRRPGRSQAVLQHGFDLTRHGIAVDLGIDAHEARRRAVMRST